MHHGVIEIFALLGFYAALLTNYQSTRRKIPKEQRPPEMSIYDAENEDAFKKHRKRNRTHSFLYNSASGVHYSRRSLFVMNRSPITYLCSAGSPLAFYNSQNSLLCQMYHFRYRYTVALSLRGFHRELHSNKSSASNQKGHQGVSTWFCSAIKVDLWPISSCQFLVSICRINGDSTHKSC